jgi:hypothetical protein
MASANPYQDLKDALQELWDILDTSEEYDAIAAAITALAVVFPDITKLIDELIGLLNQLKKAVEDLNVTGVPGLEKVTQVTAAATAIAKAAQVLLPDNKQEGVTSVLNLLSQVSGLPSLDTVKADVIKLITDINGKLAALKPA